MTPATISLPFEAALPVRRISANASLNLVILVCWSLGAVCISTSGMESGGSGIFELVKAGTRGFAFLALGAIVVAAQNASPSRAIWRLTPVALFALWAMVSTLWSPLKSVTLTHGFELLILVLLAMAIAIVCREERAMERLLGHLVTITCFVCILVLGLNFQMVRAGMRPMLYMQPNNLAAVGASGLILMCLSRVLWNWRWTTKMFWPVVMVCGATMYAARSRSAFIA